MFTNINALFEEINTHLLEDEKPSLYFEEIKNEEIFTKEHPFKLLSDLIKVEQSPKYHPEGNVWNHTMLVVDNAAKIKNHSENPKVLMWGALLHDIGKTLTTKNRRGRITSYDHDRVGAIQAKEFLKIFTRDVEFIDKVSNMVRWHMNILYVIKELPFAQIEKMKKNISAKEIVLLSTCDRMGRGNLNLENLMKERENIKLFLERCNITLDEMTEILEIIEASNFSIDDLPVS